MGVQVPPSTRHQRWSNGWSAGYFGGGGHRMVTDDSDAAEVAGVAINLHENDELHRHIGMVVAMDSAMVHSLRALWFLLVLPSPAMAVIPDDFSPLYDGLRAMLPHAEVSEEFRSRALAAVRSAKEPHDARNRVVHDLWHLPTPNGGWQRKQAVRRQLPIPSTTTVRTEDLAELVLRLRNVQAEITAVAGELELPVRVSDAAVAAMQAELGPEPDSPEDEP